MSRPTVPREGVAAALWALLLGASLVGLVAMYDPSFIGIDGAFFVSAAKNLAGGRGFATSIVWSEEHYRLGGVPAPQTNFPPGFPLLIALGHQLGFDPPYAAFLVALLAFGAIPLVLYDLLRTAGQPRRRALAISALWLGMPFGWFNVLGCMSEMPFVLLTLVSLRCLLQAERDQGRRERWLAAAGTVAGLAFTVRYQGIYFVITLGLFFLLRLIRRPDWAAARAVLLVGGPASVFVATLFLRNHLLTGKVTGAMIPEHRSLLEVLLTLRGAVAGLVGFTKSGLLGGRVSEIAFVVVAAAGLAGGVCWISRLGLDRCVLRAALARTHVCLSLAYAAVSLVLMLQGARNYASGQITSRYLLCLVPFGLLCLPEGLRLIRFTPGGVWRARAARLWLAAAVLVVVAGQVNVFHRHWEPLTRANPYRAIREAVQRPLAGETVAQFLRARVTTASPLLGNEAQLLGTVLDRPVLGLARASYTRRVWTDDQVRRLVASYGVAYVVFFPDLFDPAVAEDRNRPFFHLLERGDTPPWLVAILVAPDVRLYRVEGAAVARATS